MEISKASWVGNGPSASIVAAASDLALAFGLVFTMLVWVAWAGIFICFICVILSPLAGTESPFEG